MNRLLCERHRAFNAEQLSAGKYPGWSRDMNRAPPSGVLRFKI
jgi:hypothetical protein